MKSLIKRILTFCFKLIGYEVSFRAFVRQASWEPGGTVNLNVGAGKYTIPNFISLDVFSDHYYRSAEEFDSQAISYDMRKDRLPFDNVSVDNIYCSHVIEHIETSYVAEFISESFRVLKRGGVLRICTPDAKFLYQVSRFPNEYWSWRFKRLSNSHEYNVDWQKIHQGDFLIRELATRKFKFSKSRLTEYFEGSELIRLPFREFMEKIETESQYDPDHLGSHITPWWFEKIEGIGSKVGYSHIIESKPGGSVSRAMQAKVFDAQAPFMTLYVDLVK